MPGGQLFGGPNVSESPETPELTDEAVNLLVSLALSPNQGEPFEFGGKTFTRQFLTIDGEQALYGVVTSVMSAAQSASIAESFLISINHLIDATSVILSDQDAECDDVWVRGVRGPGLAKQMVGIVIGQIQLQEMTSVLGGLLAAAGLAHVLAAKTYNSPITSAPTA